MLNTVITLQQIGMCHAIIFKIVLFYSYEIYKYVLPFLIHVIFYISCLLSCNLSYLLHQFFSTCGIKYIFVYTYVGSCKVMPSTLQEDFAKWHLSTIKIGTQ
jgi:hypothetical protein